MNKIGLFRSQGDELRRPCLPLGDFLYVLLLEAREEM